MKVLLKAPSGCDFLLLPPPPIFSFSLFFGSDLRLTFLPLPLPLPSCYLKSKGFWTLFSASMLQGSQGRMLAVILPNEVEQVLSSRASEPGPMSSRATCLFPEWPLILPGVRHLHLGGQQAEETREGETASVCTSQLINQGEEEFLSLRGKLMQNHM